MSNSINESISYRLKNALSMNEKILPATRGYYIADRRKHGGCKSDYHRGGDRRFADRKSYFKEALPAARIAFRDTQSYFGILLDDNNRKPLARLHFNFSKKYLELFHNGKDNGERKLLGSLDDIYQYRKELLATARNYQQTITTETTITES
ncbi:hypothetical protein KRR40_46220 [Niabella defluvii]|nr:hypothetical protein KRR40_46220 [Niabella sp. I65]